MTQTTSDRERELLAHNERLADTLREAREVMVKMNEAAEDTARAMAINNAVDYVILAVDMRIAECKAAIAREVVGQEADRAQALANFALPTIFETALRAAGYEVVKCGASEVA